VAGADIAGVSIRDRDGQSGAHAALVMRLLGQGVPISLLVDLLGEDEPPDVLDALQPDAADPRDEPAAP